jgi:hypothetical protein
MEPLQERMAEVLAKVEESKEHIAKTQEECTGLISDTIASKIVDTLKEKTTQAQTQEAVLKEKFQVFTKEINEVHKG